MLTYTCPTCLKKYEVHTKPYASGGGYVQLVYTETADTINKMHTLFGENDDCHSCEEEIKVAQDKAKDDIRKRKQGELHA